MFLIEKIKPNDIAKVVHFCNSLSPDISLCLFLGLNIHSLTNFISELNNLINKYSIKNIDQEEENAMSKTCPICLDNPNNCHVIPCNHAFCFNCIKKLPNNVCPICRRVLTGVKEHLSFKFNTFNDNFNNNNEARIFRNQFSFIISHP